MSHPFRDALTLSRRIVLLVLAVTAVAVLVASAVLIRRQEAIFRSHVEQRSLAIARSAASYSVGPLAFEDHEGVEAILQGLISSELVRSAAVYDEDGALFASQRAPDARRPPTRAPAASAPPRFGREGLVVVAPIAFGGRSDGTLRLVVSTGALDAAQQQLVATMAMIVVGLLIAAALFASWLQRFVTQPLLALADTMSSVAREGRYDTRVSSERRDEIGRLQKVFDELLGRLGERERERDASEASLRALVAALPDAVVLVDSGMRVVDSPVGRTIGATRTPSLVGGRLADALPASVAARIEDAARESLDSGELRTVLFELGEGAERLSFEVVASPMPARDQAPSCVVLLVRDVSERKTMEQRAQQADKLQAIGQLAGGIAHDFNNLLAVIMTNAALVEHVSPDKAGILLQDLRNAAQRATDLVSQLLAFARRKNAVRVRTDVSELVVRVVRIVSRTVDPRIRLRTELGADDAFVESDVAQLESALINLAINARDAMPEGGEIVFATRWVRDDEPGAGKLEITVRDTGSGIPPDVLPHIFEPFFTTKPVGRGTGLGLSAVYGTVQSQGGTLSVDTALGVGTTFCIRLPRSAGEGHPASVIPPPGKLVKRSGRILFVEDDEAVRESTRFALEHAGFSVEAFERASEAIARAASVTTPFDVALVDNVMPEMTGRDLMQALRAHDPALPILLCSGGDLDPDDSSEAARPDDFLAKPYGIEELTHRIAALLDLRRAKNAR